LKVDRNNGLALRQDLGLCLVDDVVMAWPVQEPDGCKVVAIRGKKMRGNGISLTTIKVADLDAKSSTVNHTIHQSLESNPIYLRFDSLESSRAVLIERHGKEGFIAAGIQFNPSTSHQLKIDKTVST